MCTDAWYRLWLTGIYVPSLGKGNTIRQHHCPFRSKRAGIEGWVVHVWPNFFPGFCWMYQILDWYRVSSIALNTLQPPTRSIAGYSSIQFKRTLGQIPAMVGPGRGRCGPDSTLNPIKEDGPPFPVSQSLIASLLSQDLSPLPPRILLHPFILQSRRRYLPLPIPKCYYFIFCKLMTARSYEYITSRDRAHGANCS